MIKWFNILLHTRNCSQEVCKFVYLTMTECWINCMRLGFSKFTKFYYHQFLCCIYLSNVRASNCSTQMSFIQSWILYQNLRIFAKLLFFTVNHLLSSFTQWPNFELSDVIVDPHLFKFTNVSALRVKSWLKTAFTICILKVNSFKNAYKTKTKTEWQKIATQKKGRKRRNKATIIEEKEKTTTFKNFRFEQKILSNNFTS